MTRAQDRLRGQVAIVTGAAGDLGMAIAARLLDAGAKVALLDITTPDITGLSSAEHALCVAGCDISDETQVDAAVSRVVGHFGGLQLLVNNAAMVTAKAAVDQLTPAEWRRTLDVNLTGAWLMARAAMPHMRRAGGGTVLNIASQIAHVATPGSCAYAASKAGLVALARAIALDGAPDSIRGLSLSPGAVMTSRLTRRYGSEDAVNAALAHKYLAHAIGEVDEVADSALHLLAGGRFLNGIDVLVDGGYTAV